jgi:hypothetical protein
VTNLSEIDLSWAAGIIEGEGSITINKETRRNSGALIVCISNTDPQLVAWFHDRFGGYFKANTPPTRTNHRQAWKWAIASNMAAEFLRLIRPYLKTDKYIRKADLGIAYQDQKRPVGRPHDNGEYRNQQRGFYDRMQAISAEYRGERR